MPTVPIVTIWSKDQTCCMTLQFLKLKLLYKPPSLILSVCHDGYLRSYLAPLSINKLKIKNTIRKHVFQYSTTSPYGRNLAWFKLTLSTLYMQTCGNFTQRKQRQEKKKSQKNVLKNRMNIFLGRGVTDTVFWWLNKKKRQKKTLTMLLNTT